MKFLSDLFKKLLGVKKTSKFENVVVGKIISIESHPNADRLQITKTDVGSEVLQIVCGASNIEVGQMVPVALVGAKLSESSSKGGPAENWEIKEAKIRGTKSFGMICAEDELGLGENHDGIMVLDDGVEIGMKFEKYLNNK